MYKASAGLILPTSITGSLPRPSWFTAQLGRQSFLEAMVNARWREQYEDAVSVHLRAQETAGLDICTDGDSRFDDLVGGMSWMSYPLLHMDGLSHEAAPAAPQVAAAGQPRGHILHDVLEARVLPKITGPIGRGTLQYAAGRFGRRFLLPGSGRAGLGVQRGAQRRIARTGRCRLPRHPDGGAADPYGTGPRQAFR
jgi:5-methyltetrahydropteroyltriglutamate--homocysteine methyltransferase